MLEIFVILVMEMVPSSLLQFLWKPYRAGKMITFKKSATPSEQVIFSSKEEHWNPLLAKS